MEDRLAALKQKLEDGTLTDEEDQLIEQLEDAIATNTDWRLEDEEVFDKVDRARGQK